MSFQAITLQFEFILAVKCNSNLYAPYSCLLGGAGCQLSTQQFRERAVMSERAAGEGAASEAFLSASSLRASTVEPHKWHFPELTDSS